jgi:hypothetical protein
MYTKQGRSNLCFVYNNVFLAAVNTSIVTFHVVVCEVWLLTGIAACQFVLWKCVKVRIKAERTEPNA